MKNILHVGFDVGSTTVKIVIMDDDLKTIYTNYRRHFSDTKQTVCDMLEELAQKYRGFDYTIALTGSGAMSASKFLRLPFIQEVVSCKRAVEKYIPKTDVVIELGGEDAKIIYFDKSIEQRMNGTCAGGTGAFIDQMASLLNTDPTGLNELAKSYKMIYPIASRCGVFAKTDIQPLLNEGAAKEDIAVSIFQAVVNQTISGLACGRPIRGNVAFLGGPLNYLSELRKRFIETLRLEGEQIIVPEEAHLLVAKGAALDSLTAKTITTDELLKKIETLKDSTDNTTNPLQPLFDNDYKEFKARHEKAKVPRAELSKTTGDVYVGIDAGSTTSKLVVIDSEGRLVYSLYGSNKGNPLKSVMNMLKEMYRALPKGVNIACSGVTGYGEKLIQTGLNVDINEIETIAHYTAAKEFMPKVSAIVDIGGQDMKYIRLKNGAIDTIMLNEACSSGCGSFIETFAKSLNLSIEEFVNEAIKAKRPVDLGSRCTVFMNSKIKQAQKEGYSVGDISAGLSYSVIKNAIQKVMKVRDPQTLGNHIVVQGGTFYNDAVLKAFEIIVGKEVIRPDIAGLMGAYGMAILAKEQGKGTSTLIKDEDIDKLEIKTNHIRCQRCENHCLLTINMFSNGQRHISGNRCERGAGTMTEEKEQLPNVMKYKYERLFDYKPLAEDKAKRGTIGIPRVLNMYEDYPFWFTFLTNLGFRVVLSEKSNRKTYEKGMESMPSESVCYPAKLSHGHIVSLINQGIKTIFYPCVPYSRKEYKGVDNHYNCPIVISYSEVLKNNVEELNNSDIEFLNPFLPFGAKQLAETLYNLKEFKKYKFTKKEILEAAKLAEIEYQNFKDDIRLAGINALKYIKDNKLHGIVLAGRPYHTDPEVNHGIDTLITSLGMPVLTEDSVSNLAEVKRPLRVVDQWVYHARLYAAADFVGKTPELELVQLNSFGCGVDAVTTDQVQEIIESYGKMYTLIKIDEVNNLGAVRIRLRSLLATIKRRDDNQNTDAACLGNYENNRVVFTKDMRKDYTILFPLMAPIHFEILEAAVQSEGYNLKLLRECNEETVETGLKYVNNDACYPSIITTGQFIQALQSGEYDLNKTAVMMSQTGGGCRATNYIGFIRKALKDAGFGQIPIISFNFVGMEKVPGFKITLSMVKKMAKAVMYGDMLQKMLTKNRAYEIHKGETEKLYNEWLEKCKKYANKSTSKEFEQSLIDMVQDFEKIELDTSKVKPKVGIVGEVLIKYHPFGNNFVADKLEDEGAEVVLPDFMGFVKFIATHKVTFSELINVGNMKGAIMKEAIKIIEKLEKPTVEALKTSKKGYMLPCNIWELEDKVEDILSIGNQTGEGWFLTAEMVEYIEHGIPNIICVQPFACLPNHVVGKGVIKTIRNKYPEANISPVDYDPGASEANQTNRIKLLMTVAKDNLEKDKNEE